MGIRAFIKRKKILVVIALIVVLIVVVFLIFGGKKGPAYDFVNVERGDITEEVSATGTVKSAQDISLRFETSGTVEKIYVSEGAKVKRRAFLVKLNIGKTYSQFLQAEASYNVAKANLDKLLAGATREEIQVAERTVENAKVAFADAKAKADNDLAEKYDEAMIYLSNASSKVNIALSDLENFNPKYFYDTSQTSTTFMSKESLARIAFFGTSSIKGVKTIVSETVLNPTQGNIDNALTEMRAVIIKTKDILDYTREAMSGPTLREEVSSADQTSIDTDTTSINSIFTDISGAQQAISSQKITSQTNINSAENALNKAEDDLAEIKAVPREVDIAVYRAEVDKARASLVEFQQKLDDATLKSPIDATVTKINVKIGETVTAGGSSTVSLISENKFQIEVDIPEADIGKISLGDLAIIKLDAFPEEERSGKVAEMEPAETIIEGVTYYRVTVVFDQLDAWVKSGMSADLTIVTEKKEGVLFVPYRAIVYNNNKKFVRVLAGEEVKEIEVEVGLKGNKGEVEIIKGLSEGEKIISFIKK